MTEPDTFLAVIENDVEEEKTVDCVPDGSLAMDTISEILLFEVVTAGNFLDGALDYGTVRALADETVLTGASEILADHFG